MPQQAWSAKRERQYEHIKDEREGAGRVDEARQGDRRPHGQQGARPDAARRRQSAPHVAQRHLLGPARRPALRHERPGRAAPRSSSTTRPSGMNIDGPLEDEQGPAPARRRSAQVAACQPRGPAALVGYALRGGARRPSTTSRSGSPTATASRTSSPAASACTSIERTDAFTLVGSDARRGKLTLFAEEGPRERGAAQARRPARLRPRAALADLPEDVDGRAAAQRRGLFRRLGGATPRPGRGDHGGRVRPRPCRALCSTDPAATAQAYVPLGFNAAEPGPSRRRPCRGRWRLRRASSRRCDGARAAAAEPPGHARGVGRGPHRRGEASSASRSTKVVDAANTYAVFVWGPERVKLEYVEHKPGFALT